MIMTETAERLGTLQTTEEGGVLIAWVDGIHTVVPDHHRDEVESLVGSEVFALVTMEGWLHSIKGLST